MQACTTAGLGVAVISKQARCTAGPAQMGLHWRSDALRRLPKPCSIAAEMLLRACPCSASLAFACQLLQDEPHRLWGMPADQKKTTNSQRMVSPAYLHVTST